MKMLPAIAIWLAVVWDVDGAALDHWTVRSMASNASARSVTFGAGKFVAAGNRGTNLMMSSDDGIAWTIRSYPPDPISNVTFANGIFVGVGVNAATARSTNGVNWSISKVSDTGLKGLSAITHGNGLFVAAGVSYRFVGGSSQRQAAIYTSADGLAWSEWIAQTSSELLDVAYGAGRYVAVNAAYTTAGDPNRALWVSTNGVDWAPRNPAGFGDVTAITYGRGQFVAMDDAGENATALTSPDGENWVAHHLPVGGNPRVHSMHFANGTYMALGSFDNTRYLMLLSTNGVSWRTNDLALPGNVHAGHLYDAAFGHGTFFVVGNSPVRAIVQSASVVPAWFERIERAGAGATRLDISGEAGRPYHLQFSTNLVDWHHLLIYTNGLPTIRVIDSAAGPATRIYRAVTD